MFTAVAIYPMLVIVIFQCFFSKKTVRYWRNALIESHSKVIYLVKKQKVTVLICFLTSLLVVYKIAVSN